MHMQKKEDETPEAMTQVDYYPHFYDDTKCVCLVHPGVQVHHASYGCVHEPVSPAPPPVHFQPPRADSTGNAAAMNVAAVTNVATAENAVVATNVAAAMNVATAENVATDENAAAAADVAAAAEALGEYVYHDVFVCTLLTQFQALPSGEKTRGLYRP